MRTNYKQISQTAIQQWELSFLTLASILLNSWNTIIGPSNWNIAIASKMYALRSTLQFHYFLARK